MTSIDRTIYPRLSTLHSEQDLSDQYTPSDEDMAFVTARTDETPHLRLSLMVQLKIFQQLGYFLPFEEAPAEIISHIRAAMGLDETVQPSYEVNRTRYRHRRTIRSYLGVHAYDSTITDRFVERVIDEAAQLINDPADLINVAVEALLRERYELPTFRALDELVRHVRHRVHEAMFQQVANRLTEEEKAQINTVLDSDGPAKLSEWSLLKKPTGRPSVTHLRQLKQRLDRLMDFVPVARLLKGVLPGKILHFAAEAAVLDAKRLRETRDARSYTLFVCYLYQAQVKARDELVEMFLERMRRIHNRGQEELQAIHRQQRATTEQLVAVLSQIVDEAGEGADDARLGSAVRELLQEAGGLEQIQTQCEQIAAHSNNDYYPLLYHFYKQHRSLLFDLVRLLDLHSASQDRSLLEAVQFMLDRQPLSRAWWKGELDLSFATQRWRQHIVGQHDGQPALNRRLLELCLFSYIANELRSGDLYVPGSQDYADPRQQFLSWEECQPLLDDYCRRLGFPSEPERFVRHLREQLMELAEAVDGSFAENGQLKIDAQGEATLKRIQGRPTPAGAVELRQTLEQKMPERELIDILYNVHDWTNWSRHWGPRTGFESQLSDELLAYILATFGYGCNLGPWQTARHTRQVISADMLAYVNQQHVTVEKLDAAVGDLVNLFARFRLPRFWGTGRSAAADGTHVELYTNNLLAEYSRRHGAYGGIAYHYVADTYIALFSQFITCGVWEGVYILDLLHRNTSNVQPDILHADTHGQSTPIFALAYLLGIDLRPRIRRWQDLILFRPDAATTYEHIDALFGVPIRWELIEKHWRDLMQIALSVQQRRLLPSTLLRKLGYNSRKNRLYKAFRELGRVIRTMFLLRFISDLPMRRRINEETNKVEAYHDFTDWLGFGSAGVISHNAPEEHQKRIRYSDLVANAVMLQNVVDMTRLLPQLAKEGYVVNPETLRTLSPYMRSHIKRFGTYILDLEQPPEPLDIDPALFPVVQVE